MTQLMGDSGSDDGVLGTSTATGKAGVAGVNETLGVGGGNGIFGRGSGNGVFGESTAKTTAGGAGVVGNCTGDGDGVRGFSVSPNRSGVVGTNNGGGFGVLGQATGNSAVAGVSSGTGAGVFGESREGPAGFFKGDVVVTGDIRLTNADCAEQFDCFNSAAIEPGTVVILEVDGAISESTTAYDKRVAGIVSGAGAYKPAIILDKIENDQYRKNVALIGKVYCKVDASYERIEIGDLLTTSPTPGHAMKAVDPYKAFGSVIGKAMGVAEDGTTLIPVLVALQ